MNFIPKETTLGEIVDKMHESVRQNLAVAVAINRATHVVLFENLDLCSSMIGQRTVMCIGPGCVYKTVEETHNRHLGDVPSRFQWPTLWAPVEEGP